MPSKPSPDFEAWLAFSRKVYGDKLYTGFVENHWRRSWVPGQRVRVRFADGKIRDGVVVITQGPEPRFVLRRNTAARSGGYSLGAHDKPVAVKVGRTYEPIRRHR